MRKKDVLFNLSQKKCQDALIKLYLLHSLCIPFSFFADVASDLNSVFDTLHDDAPRFDERLLYALRGE
jgi:hypothetical protein